MALIDGYHHVTMSVAGAQEDNDFHTITLGIKSVKKTVLFDGTAPVYHLYYGNETGDPSTIGTTFPFRKLGIYGKRGTNQSKIIQLSIPKGSADFWVNRLGTEPGSVVEFFMNPTYRKARGLCLAAPFTIWPLTPRPRKTRWH